MDAQRYDPFTRRRPRIFVDTLAALDSWDRPPISFNTHLTTAYLYNPAGFDNHVINASVKYVEPVSTRERRNDTFLSLPRFPLIEADDDSSNEDHPPDDSGGGLFYYGSGETNASTTSLSTVCGNPSPALSTTSLLNSDNDECDSEVDSGPDACIATRTTSTIFDRETHTVERVVLRAAQSTIKKPLALRPDEGSAASPIQGPTSTGSRSSTPFSRAVSPIRRAVSRTFTRSRTTSRASTPLPSSGTGPSTTLAPPSTVCVADALRALTTLANTNHFEEDLDYRERQWSLEEAGGAMTEVYVTVERALHESVSPVETMSFSGWRGLYG